MKDSVVFSTSKMETLSNSIAAAFVKLHAHRARTLTGLTGGLIMLPIALHAQQEGTVALSKVASVRSFEILEDGTVRVTLSNGRSVLLKADDVVVVGEEIMVSVQAAEELAALGVSESGVGAIAGLGGLAALAAAAGGGGSGGESGPSNAISKTLTIVDAPLQNALVFYDANGDGRPGAVEYLGLTDANGAIDIEYEPTPEGTFLIIPAPVVNAEQYADIGWNSAFTQQFAGLTTRDVVTDNVFTQVLLANDAGEGVDQVVSPLSTLVAAGVPEQVVKDAFGLSADTNIDTFNFFTALTNPSSTPDQLAEAKAAASAAISITSIVNAAITATQAQKQAASGETQELTTLEIAQVTTRAIQAAADVMKASVSTGANLALGDIAQIATAVAVTRQLNDAVVDDAKAIQIALELVTDAVSSGDVSNSVADNLQALADRGEINSTTITTATDTAAAVRVGTQTIQTVLENNNPTDANFAATFKETLDQADDNTDAAINDIVNRELLGINLGVDLQIATEGQDAVIKGNLLSNDRFSDGTALPPATQIVSVNGRAVADTVVYDATGSIDYAQFMISTADRWSSWFTSGGSTVSNEIIENAINLQMELPGAAITGMPATWGSAIAGQLLVNAGDTIDFNYFFGSEDYLPWNDYSFFAVQQVDGSGNAIGSGEVLRNTSNTPGDAPLDVRDLKGPAYYTLAGQWAVQSDAYTYTFEEAGTYNFAFGVTDVGDRIFDTFAWVTDINTRDADGNETSALVAGSIQKIGNVVGDLGQSEIQVPDTVTATLLTGFYGTLIIQEDGDYLYQVGGANADDVPPGITVTDNFTYRVETPNGRVATQQLNVQITGVDEGTNASVVTLQVSDANSETASRYVVSGTLQNVEAANLVLTITQVGVPSPATIIVPAAQIETINDGETVTFFVRSLDLADLSDGPFEVRANYIDINGAQRTIAQQAELDTSADTAPSVSFEVFTTPVGLSLRVDGLDDDASAVVTVSVDGANPVVLDIATNGVFATGLPNFASASVAYDIQDDAGNTVSAVVLVETDGGNVLNVDTGTLFETLQQAVDAAGAGDTLQLAAGYLFNEDILVDKPLTIEGANAGILLPRDPSALDSLELLTQGASQIKSVTIAAPNVRIDGVVFHSDAFGGTSDHPPLSWDASATDGLDGFTLANSVLIGYSAANAPRFESLAADANVTDWSFTGNLIGGVTSGNGGSLNLTGVANLTIAENMFWRPGAGHLYLTSVTNAAIEDNFFYHGLHAGGANFDNMLSDGDSGLGAGYGYGGGYGGGGTSGVFFGRNFWMEFKGTNANVTIQGNDGQYNSGGIQLYGETAGTTFEDFLISNNVFRDFVNADPTGVLGEGRAQSGFMGAIALSVADGSIAQNIEIENNIITAALDQVYSVKDQFALISIQGNVQNVATNNNQVTWLAQSSGTILTQLSELGLTPSNYATGAIDSVGVVVGLAYVGPITGTIDIQGNTISEEMGPAGGGFYAIYIDGDGITELVDGNTTTSLSGDMTAIITETGNTLNLSGSNSVPILIVDLPATFPINESIADSRPIYAATDVDGDSSVEFYRVNLGTAGDDILSMSEAREFIVGQQGFDTIDVAGGSAIVGIQFGLPGGDYAEILNFTAGPPSDPSSDFIPYFLSNGFELRGEGFQSYTPGGVIGANSGIFQISDFNGWAENESDAFFDAISDDENVILVYDVTGGDAGARIEAFAGNGLSEGGGAFLSGVSATLVTAETFLIDSYATLPDV